MTMRILAMISGLALVQACNAISPELLVTKDAPLPPDDTSGPGMDGMDGLPDTPEPGLILRYRFEDSGFTVSDSSGRKKDGTVFLAGASTPQDTPTMMAWTADGRNGRGLALSGLEYVSLPNGVLTDVDDFTIATWVKLRSSVDWARIYDFGNPSNMFMYLTISGYEPNPDPNVVIFDGVHMSSFAGVNNENWFGTDTRLPTLVWKHLAVTGSGGDRHLYIDGFPAAANLGGRNIPPSQMEPMFPNSWLGKSHYNDIFDDPKLSGTLDDFRIYNRVLSATEIADLALPQHDYSYWRFNETTGTSAKDSSDNNLMATATEVTWTTGRLGGAVRLSGAQAGPTGPHLSLATSPLATCTEFTVAVWLKPEAIDSSRIFDFGTGANSYIYLSLTDGTGLHFGMAAPGKTTFNLAAPPELTVDGRWHHIAVTLLAGTVRIFVDGVQKATMGGTTIRPTDLGATTENWIGQSRVMGVDRYLNGSLDELRIACRAYTPDEITNLSRP